MAYDLQLPEKDLPMISAVATQALQLINRPNVTNNELNDLIRQDPSLAGRVLHIANSPFYGGRFQARRISDAIVRMGMRQLRNILVVAATGELFDVRDPIVRGFWDHALTVATLGDRIASELSLADTEEVFIAGLLHDIGKFIIYQQHPAPYSDVIQQAQASGRRLIDVEDELFKYFNHVTIGARPFRPLEAGRRRRRNRALPPCRRARNPARHGEHKPGLRRHAGQRAGQGNRAGGTGPRTGDAGATGLCAATAPDAGTVGSPHPVGDRMVPACRRADGAGGVNRFRALSVSTVNNRH